MPEKYRVLIVEDDEHTRARLSDAITQASNYVLAGAYGTLKQAKAGLQTDQPDVLLVDLGLPDGSGIDLIRTASRDLPNIRIMVISVFGDECHVIDAIEAGAHGYLLKDADAIQIEDSIEQLINGGSPITPSVAIYLLKRFQNKALEPVKETDISLTDREQDVLQLIAKGLTYSEVSDSLVLSINTIRVHMKNLFRKLAVTSRSEAVFEAVEKGILKM
jgi:DNA-binding NarL/FixJ family response regulator